VEGSSSVMKTMKVLLWKLWKSMGN